jgi:2'-hydroxyisoflavone reductase
VRILIIGGTRFVGRHIANAALAAGHDVTLLHRGLSGADLFPSATHLIADRNRDLEVLSGTEWDATVDVSAYFPSQVDALAQALSLGSGHYVYISSVSVYQAPKRPGYDESEPVRELPPGPVPETITDDNYGALKVACERTAIDHFGLSTLVLRPTYVIGPWDRSGRFTYWVQRLMRGGEVLCPGYPDRAIQTIDARDHAAFALHGVESGVSGVFHTTSQYMPFGELLERIAAEVAPPGTKLTWVGPEFLLEAGETGESIPLWYAGNDDDAAINTADSAAALRAGMTLRPLAESIRDVAKEPPVTRDFLTLERESELLARWR